MGRKVITYVGGLIALYLVVEHYTGAGTLLDKGAGGGVGLVKALQGR